MHPATLQQSKKMLLKQDYMRRQYLFHACKEYLWGMCQYSVKYLCSLQYLNLLKSDFCKDFLSSVEAACMPSIGTLKGGLRNLRNQ